MIRRLTKRAEFLFVRHGARAVRPTVLIEARRRQEAGPVGMGLTASKKVGGAVVRNRARRRLREAARQLLPKHGLPGVDYVLVARAETAEAPWDRLLDDVGNALIRLRADLENPRGSGPRSRVARPRAPATESD